MIDRQIEAAGRPAITPTADTPILEAVGLTRHFDVSPPLLNRILERRGKQYLKAVQDVSFSLRKGETFSLVGESGCGKSTVARLAVGLYAPTAGAIRFAGVDIGRASEKTMAPLRRNMQMIFQDPYASLNPRWRVRDIVAEPIRAFHLIDGKTAIVERVGELLTQVGLSPSDGEKYPHEFSGGQRQRISIARALASQPELLVCDEPTSALDVSVQAQILNLMKKLQRSFNLTYLFISHDLAVISHVSDRVGVMYLGRLVEVSPARTIFRAPKHPYTRMLLDAIPDVKMSGRERMPIGGEVPSPISPPPGCAFHPRCPFATERCMRELPLSKVAEDDTLVACHGVEEGRLPAYGGPGMSNGQIGAGVLGA